MKEKNWKRIAYNKAFSFYKKYCKIPLLEDAKEGSEYLKKVILENFIDKEGEPLNVHFCCTPAIPYYRDDELEKRKMVFSGDVHDRTEEGFIHTYSIYIYIDGNDARCCVKRAIEILTMAIYRMNNGNGYDIYTLIDHINKEAKEIGNGS